MTSMLAKERSRTKKVRRSVQRSEKVAIQAGARELFFGLLFTNAMLLFVRSDLNRRLVPLFAAVLVGLALVRFGVLPEMVFY